MSHLGAGAMHVCLRCVNVTECWKTCRQHVDFLWHDLFVLRVLLLVQNPAGTGHVYSPKRTALVLCSRMHGFALLQFWDEQYWLNFKAERDEEQRNKREAAQRARQSRDGVRAVPQHRSVLP